jgi:hypothetical protein
MQRAGSTGCLRFSFAGDKRGKSRKPRSPTFYISGLDLILVLHIRRSGQL